MEDGGWLRRRDDRFGFAKLVRAAQGFILFVVIVSATFLQLRQPRSDRGLLTSDLRPLTSDLFRAPLMRLLHDLRDLCDLINAHERVHLWKQFRQLLAEALRETTGDDQTLTAILRLAHLGGFKDRVHAFFLRGINERTGVDDHHVGECGIVRDLDAALHERTEHDLGVHEIFRATERDESDLERCGVGFWFCHRRAG